MVSTTADGGEENKKKGVWNCERKRENLHRIIKLHTRQKRVYTDEYIEVEIVHD